MPLLSEWISLLLAQSWGALKYSTQSHLQCVSVTGHRVTFQHWTQEARGGWDGTLCVRHYYGGGSVVKNGPHLGGNVAKLLVTTLWQNTLFLSARPLSLL